MADDLYPLDPKAATIANWQLWANYPELHGRQLTLGQEDAEYRKEWMKQYKEAKKQTQPPPPRVQPEPVPEKPAPVLTTAPVQSCPLIETMTHEQKMTEAIKRVYAKRQISAEVLTQLPDLEELAIGVVVVGGVLAGLGVVAGAVASTGVGAVIEGIAAGIVMALAAMGCIVSGKQIIIGIETLIKFYDTTRCDKGKTPEDLDKAGKDFATGIAEAGVGTVMMVLSMLGARQGLKMGESAVERWNKLRPQLEEPSPIPQKSVSNVEIVDSQGKPIGEFDEIDISNKRFVEDKSAKGLDAIHPRTGKPVQTPTQWAEKQIYDKTVVRISNLEKAVATRPGPGETSSVPSLDEIKNIKELKFRVESDTPEVRNAVNVQIERLKTDYPDWKFSAEFGEEQ